jgi:hypothetical protein
MVRYKYGFNFKVGSKEKADSSDSLKIGTVQLA